MRTDGSRVRGLALALLALLALLFAAPAGAETWKVELDPAATQVRFTLSATLHTVHGTARLLKGSVTFDPARGSAGGDVVVDATSMATGNSMRDRRMHGEIMKSDQHPLVVFWPHHVTGQLAAAGSSRLTFEGEMSLLGKHHPLTLVLEIHPHGGEALATGTFSVPYVRWGVMDPSHFLLHVAKSVEVTVEAVGHLERVKPTTPAAVDSPQL